MLLLIGCASVHSPAPVTGVDYYNKYQKGSYRGSTYKVSRGETLYAISWRTGVSVPDLARLNRIGADYTIYPGQVLLLRQPSGRRVSAKASQASGTPPAVARKSTRPADTTSSGSREKTVAPVSRKEYAVNPAEKVHSSSKAAEVNRWQWPTKGTVVKGFSATGQGNKGIDIAGRAGQPIYATADGKVVYAGNALRGYGNLVIVKHNDEYLSAYAHNQRIMVQEQQSVRAGQQIATMGRSGTVDVRLHFEIRFRGKSVNPLRYLPKQ